MAGESGAVLRAGTLVDLVGAFTFLDFVAPLVAAAGAAGFLGFAFTALLVAAAAFGLVIFDFFGGLLTGARVLGLARGTCACLPFEAGDISRPLFAAGSASDAFTGAELFSAASGCAGLLSGCPPLVGSTSLEKLIKLSNDLSKAACLWLVLVH